jgi:hypothetical protein
VRVRRGGVKGREKRRARRERRRGEAQGKQHDDATMTRRGEYAGQTSCVVDLFGYTSQHTHPHAPRLLLPHRAHLPLLAAPNTSPT